MLKTILILLMVLLEIFDGVSCEESAGDFGITQPTEEYLQIFKNIPTLFEFLIGSLQEKPEILEKDDVTIFRIDDKGVSKRSASNDIYETDVTAENSKHALIKDKKIPKKYNRRNKRDFGINDGDQLIDNILFKKDGNFLSVTGLPLSRLSSDEVEQQAIRVEEMLEDYNRSKRQ